ncbi:hypothetical protein [Reyranella sp.]|uniref:hypothetical protein n=1 Tax=Reyranella sp. TaxID=1929291 RepID=UPI003D0C6C19
MAVSGRGGGAGSVGGAEGGTGGDAGCESGERITAAVTRTATSGNPTSRAGRTERHASLPVILRQ